MFQAILVQPIYNCFVWLIGVVPHGDVGLAIIILTLLVRAVFYPAFAASIRTNMAMQAVQPELDIINEKYKDNAEERGRSTMELFKKHRIRPFSSVLALLVQIPVLIALYYAFFRLGLPKIDTALLYPFVQAPAVVDTQFLGLLNMLAAHNIFITVLVAVLQYLVLYYSLSRMQVRSKSPEHEAAQRLQRNMMLYGMPAMMGAITFTFPAGAGLYFATGNLISLGQEWLIRRKPL